MKNLLTDIAGVRVGHADDARLASGVTAVIFDRPAVAAIDVRGGGPGTREGALLDLANTVERIDAVALGGGSAFGLEAGGGVQAWLAEQGRGFRIREAVTNSLDNIAAGGHVRKRDLTDGVGRRLPDDDVAVDIAQLDSHGRNAQPLDRDGHHDAPGRRGLRLRGRRLLSAGRASGAETQE